MNEFLKAFQSLQAKNRNLSCEITFKNNVCKVTVKNGSTTVISCSSMSPYNAGNLAFSQLSLHKEELV